MTNLMYKLTETKNLFINSITALVLTFIVLSLVTIISNIVLTGGVNITFGGF